MKNNPKLINAWCFYDWANSVHSLVIVTAIFPIYFSATAVEADGSEWMNFLGFRLRNSVVFSYSVSAAFLLIALTSPLFSAIADYSGRKLSFMKAFCYVGSLSCAGLFFFTRETATLSTFLFIFSLVGWAGSIVFYNSFLPDITTEDRFDAVSARGFSMGYIGSVLLLIFNLSMVLAPQLYGGISSAMASRISFLTVGLWWAGFAQIPFARLPEGTRKARSKDWLLNGFRQLGTVLGELKHLPTLKRFLLAFFFYNMGVQTVMYLATLFGDQELGLPTESLITVMLILQLLAVAGAWAFARLSARVGNFRALMGAVLVWIGICLGAYFVYTGPQFYGLAAVVGLVMGGIQALSRSTYAKLIPAHTPDTASYFSFYDVTEKVSIVLGTAAFGLVQQLTGSMRNSVLVIGGLFIIGFVLLGLLSRQKIGSPVLR